MHNKYGGVQTRYKYLTNADDSLFSVLERRSYNHVIDKLNSENEYLSKNMKQLIMENMVLKNKLYHAWDSSYTTKQNGRNDVALQMQRLKRISLSPEERRRPERSPLWKKKQQKDQRQQEAIKPERQNSPGGSDFKRETIIEELSESNFQSKSETPKGRQEKKGLFLSKQVGKLAKPAEKMVKSVGNKRSDALNLKEKEQKIEVKAEMGEQKEVSQTKQLVLHEEEPQSNPQKVYSTPQQKTKHKKDNSPYLQIVSSQLKSQPTYNRPPSTSYKNTEQYNSPISNKREKYSNKAYLPTSAK